MKLVTFEADHQEQWGFLAEVPAADEPWVFQPGSLVRKIEKAVLPTSSLWIGGSPFCQDWPEDLVSFLATEEQGMAELQRLCDYVQKALQGGRDWALLMQSARPLSKVHLKAPIPRPRVYFGLVQNGPPFIRNHPTRHSTNLFPMGHNRTHGSVVGHDDMMVFREDSSIWGYNVELGIVIGKKGRYVPADRAMDYVAGYVPIIDACTDGYYNKVNGEPKGWQEPAGSDWFQGATLSWGGKKADTMGAMGPYLVTKGEIANVYDLLCYSRQSGLLRDRTHTGCHLLGVERLVHWYSSFATICPGDVLHLGTMGVDGLYCDTQMQFGPDDYLEVEIEKIGSLRTRVVVEHVDDWRPEDDVTKTVHPSPAVRELIGSGQACIDSVEDWNLQETRHYWTLYGNYRSVKEIEGLEPAAYPRILNTPVSSLGISGVQTEIPPRATTIDIGIELACVLRKIAFRVTAEDADEYILGYTPLISISDRSFADVLVEPATPQEAGLPVVYGRWADHFNVILDRPVDITPAAISQLAMAIEVPGVGRTNGSTSEYVLDFPKILEFITRYVTMFPGDVITAGRIGQRITAPAHTLANAGPTVSATIEGMPEVCVKIKRQPNREETVIRRSATVVGQGD